MATPAAEAGASPVRWAKVIDHTRCIGCHACSTACKSENDVPLSVNRTYVKYVDIGVFPEARRAFQVTRCNQCELAPCAVACPTGAMYRRADGIVDFDKSICIGCKACIAACPYDAIFINPEDRSAEKCNFCAHRIDMGLEPACVVVCPVEAILVGDLEDSSSRVSHMVHRQPVSVRRSQKETHPKLFYTGAHEATLNPIAALRPPGELFMWSEQTKGAHHVVSGHPGHGGHDGRTSAGEGGPPGAGRVADAGPVSPANTAAAAVLAYDVPHKTPWDWRVSLYTLTKGIAAGVYLVAVLAVLAGWIGSGSAVWQWGVPLVGAAFLAFTGGLLIWDLEHPERFYMIFTKRRWESWLVRGAFIIGGYGTVLALHFLGVLFGRAELVWFLMFAGLPLAALTAVYTAYLFAQAKARDLWQNPLLPPHLLVQSVLAGAGALVPAALWPDPTAVVPLLWLLAGASLVHLLMVAGETTITHATAHAHLAAHEMARGRYRGFFWIGIVLTLFGVAAPWVGVVAGPAALLGLLAFEHAYVQAGQSVPLA
jgi:Fe-S-cluster-containing dehydrogenase component/formate-dependent nitrite reductase membrane component NrfD